MRNDGVRTRGDVLDGARALAAWWDAACSRRLGGMFIRGKASDCALPMASATSRFLRQKTSRGQSPIGGALIPGGGLQELMGCEAKTEINIATMGNQQADIM